MSGKTGHAQDELRGFWESASFSPDGLRVEAWALRKSDGIPPETFTVSWGNSRLDLPPNSARADVTLAFGFSESLCGLRVVVPLPSDVTSDWTALSLWANWAGASSLELQKLRNFPTNELARFGFTTFDDFQNLYQNPAFRLKDPVLQAYGAARALKIAGGNRAFWLSAAILAIYRCFEDNIFPRPVAETLINDWKTIARNMEATAQGAMLRWATSMHLAVGYAHLAWGQYEEARQEFTAITRYADRIETWPQAVTNIGIGIFIGAWLEWRRGDVEAAKLVLAPADVMFQRGVGVLKIWNWHMYEELRGAVGISQMCFSFLKRLENERQAHIMPPTVVLKLSQVSVVMRRLIERGLVIDEQLPAGEPKSS